MKPNTIYVSIGNSDDKLTQSQWSLFVADVNMLIRTYAETVHGQWFSAPDSRWQNACWCFVLGEDPRDTYALRRNLRLYTHRYGQDSIAWVGRGHD